MSQLTHEQTVKILGEAIDAQCEGNFELSRKIMMQIPMDPVFAKIIKDTVGVQYLDPTQYNLSEVEKRYGKEWLAK